MSSIPIIPSIAVLAVGCTLFYHYILYPAFLSPLAKIPSAHPSASISPAWIILKRFYNEENKTIHAAHKKLGPIVRLGPNEVSVNSYDGGLRTIYAGGFDKHAFYPNLFPNFDGVPVMFSMAHSKPHSLRKRMLSNVYSKTYLLSSPSMAALSHALIYQRILPKVQRFAATPSGEMEVHALFNQITMDFVTAYQFGLCNSSNFIEDEALASWWMGLFHERRKYMFWPQEFPEVPALLSKIGIRLVPAWVSESNTKLDNWCMKLCDAVSKTKSATATDDENRPENIPVVFRQLTTAIANEHNRSEKSASPQQAEEQRLMVASEMHDHLAAGQETSSITLTYLFWELSRDQTLQDSLRAELLTLFPKIQLPTQSNNNDTPALPHPRDIDALPLLDAVLHETLRLHAAIPGPEPRLTPPTGTTLGPPGDNYPVPGNVRVSSQPYTMHRLPSVFPSPNTFNPHRWIPTTNDASSDEEKETDAERLREMHRNFWAFSSGGRMCIGSHFAIQEIKLVVAALVMGFRVLPGKGGDEGMEQLDAYVAQPEGGRLMLRFEAM